MKLSEIMSHADLATYPEVGLILFLAAFAVVARRVMRRDKSEDDYASSLPLSEGEHLPLAPGGDQ